MVYVFLADGFEETEAVAPIDILRRSGADVVTVGVGAKTVTSSHKLTVTADISEDEVTTEGVEAVVLPGGMPGTLNLEKNETVRKMLGFAAENGKLICAICAAPSILGHNGLLEGRRATCFPGFEKELFSAEVTGEPVVRDGNIITARGAGVAIEFALAISEALCGAEKARYVKESMQCQ